MAKQWKENPPGPEQLALNSMFDNDDIEDSDTPASIQSRVPMFQVFSNSVFACHFCKTNAKFGYFAKSIDADIPEMGQSGPVVAAAAASTSQSRKRASTSDVHFKNAPHVTWVYTDHEKKCDIVCVAVPNMSGARDVDFFLCEGNITLNISYIWPSSVPQELFRNRLNGGTPWTMNDPKIHTFMSRLVECGLTKNSLPEASIVIKLPMKVLRESHLCTADGVKTNDGQVVMFEFQAFQKDQIIQDADTKIKFE